MVVLQSRGLLALDVNLLPSAQQVVVRARARAQARLASGNRVTPHWSYTTAGIAGPRSEACLVPSSSYTFLPSRAHKRERLLFLLPAATGLLL